MAVNVPSWIRATIYSASSIVFGVILGFFSKAEWKQFFRSTPIKYINIPISYILFPICLAFNLGMVILAGIEIYNGGFTPKNIKKIMIESFKTAQTITALASILTTFAKSFLTVAAMLVVVIAIETAFYACNAALHAWLWYNAATFVDTYQNKMLTIKYGISFLINLIVTIGIGIMLLAALSPPALLIIGICTAIITAMSGIISALLGYYIDQKTSDANLIVPFLEENSEQDDNFPRPESAPRFQHAPIPNLLDQSLASSSSSESPIPSLTIRLSSSSSGDPTDHTQVHEKLKNLPKTTETALISNSIFNQQSSTSRNFTQPKCDSHPIMTY